MQHKKKQLRCANCGYSDRSEYIVWEDEPYCRDCFAEKIHDFAQIFPIQLANELHLDILEVPDEAED